MNRHANVAAALLAGALTCVDSSAAEYRPLNIDGAHSRIGFTASTLLFSVDGQFRTYEIMVDGDASNYPAAKVRVRIESASIFTANGTRDRHLAGSDFFDVRRYPRISFVSDHIEETPDGLELTGTLDMHGRRKRLTIPFQISEGRNGAGEQATIYTGRLAIDRNDWGVGSDSVAAKISLMDEVVLDLVVLTTP